MEVRMEDDFSPPATEPKKKTWIIILIIAVVVLCCCCGTLIAAWNFGDTLIEMIGLDPSILDTMNSY